VKCYVKPTTEQKEISKENANAFGGTFVFFANAQTNAKKSKRATKPTHQRYRKQWTTEQRQTEHQQLTAVWQKWRFCAPQTHLWLIKVWFSASTFVVKIATFAKPQNVTCNAMATLIN
jgi:hypothetical protein